MNVVFNETIIIFSDSQAYVDCDVSDAYDDEQQRVIMQVEHVEEKKMNLLKMMMLFRSLSMMIMIIIVLHPHHLFCSNKISPLQLIVQDRTLLLGNV
jgi:hypothetical protein